MVAVREPTHIAARAGWELGEVNTHAICIWELLSFGEGRKDERRRDLNWTKEAGCPVVSGQCGPTQSGQVLLISIWKQGQGMELKGPPVASAAGKERWSWRTHSSLLSLL